MYRKEVAKNALKAAVLAGQEKFRFAAMKSSNLPQQLQCPALFDM